MPWPQATDYNCAIQCPRVCFSDPDLRQGQAEGDLFGLPRPHAGNFADVYQVRGPDGQAWAVKCFTRAVPGLRDRYHAVSDHLAGRRRRFTVDFRYLPEGVRVRGDWFPVLKMRWVEGPRLNEFVRDHADKPAVLEKLALLWVRLAADLREARLGHGDLQHGNVLLVPGSGPQSLKLKLIDYDGLWVPALAERPSGELGHPNYQHPERLRDGLYGPEVDRFSHLLICAALRCVQAGGRELWDRYDNGENLLFREDDFRRPGDSRLLAELWALDAADAHALVGRLILASQSPAAEVPHLEELAGRGAVEPLSAAEEGRVCDLLRVAPRARARVGAGASARVLAGAGVRPGVADTVATLAMNAETLPEVEVMGAAPPVALPMSRFDPGRLARFWPVGLAAAGLAVVLVLVLSVRLLVWSLDKRQQSPAAGPQPARLRDLPELTARAGQRGAVEVAVERGDSAGPLTVRLEGAPERVTCRPLTLEPGQDAGRLELGATADAAGAYPVRVTLWDGDRQTDVRDATLTVADLLKPEMRRKVGHVLLRPGVKVELIVEVDRHDCAEPLTLKLEGLPRGVTQRPVPAGPGEKLVRLELSAARDAPTGYAVAKLSLWAGPVEADGETVKIDVDRKAAPSPYLNPVAVLKDARLAVKGPVALRAGGARDVLVELERGGHEGAVGLRVEGLPAGVTCDASEVPAGKDNAVVEFRAAAGAAVVAAAVRVEAWADGRKLSEQEVRVTVEKPAAPAPARPAAAAASEPREVSFFTGDGVTLAATYYAGRLGKDGGCVLLLHDPDPKGGPAAEDWGRLARGLQARGHAVLRLDFRGHGGSTKVSPQFWARPENRRYAPPFGGGLTALHNLPTLVNDVAVARLFLDWSNDNGELNSANLIVVGAGGGATVGMLWLASECARFDKTDGRATQPESRHVAAAVWLDLAPTFPGRPHNPQHEWLPAVSKHGVPMNFVCGAKAERNVRAAGEYLGLVKPVAADPQLCAVTAVPNTDKAGQHLLSEPATGRSIEDYVGAVLKHKVRPWVKRGALRRESYWKVGKKTISAKLAAQPVMLPVPVELFGVR